MKKLFDFLKGSKTKKINLNESAERKDYFGQKDLPEGEEERWKKEIFNVSMDPREWMARFGHNILAGDFRMYRYKDKEFEKWIHKGFEALTNEGLENLWTEFLTDEEIEKVKEAYDSP